MHVSQILGKAMLGFLLAATLSAGAFAQTLIAPSDATASNEIGGAFGVLQTINGNGLHGTALSSTHELVTDSNYNDKFWISTAEASLPVNLVYRFDSAPTLSGVAVWNAVFETPLQGHYLYDGAPSLFDLEVTYSGGTQTYQNVALSTTEVAGQRFDFCENLTAVTEIRFTIQADSRPSSGSDKNIYLSEFRGLQEATPTCNAPLPGVIPPSDAQAVPVPVGSFGHMVILSGLLMTGYGLAARSRRKQAATSR